ncbi:hypothetical protein I7X12_06935 [Halosimplex litoreum]|uniref:Sulfatase N-terminal domain-containing protein n=1 Tax=Halosimplex litoreum TaxID=1198301 RepID=A0A7T3G1R3_9EURY|nr:hypothetical protein [Halosimplex litoreum]QPV64343.1 hypothetical protein I7X12_06935 [Halosimplex litoreum]
MDLDNIVWTALDRSEAVLPFSPKQVMRSLGFIPWRLRGPIVRAAEYRYQRATYPDPLTPIWERDWDLLVVLDACRPEWMAAVEDEYGFVSDTGTIHSVGSHSKEWISNTFTSEYDSKMEDTIYITGNHYAEGLGQSPLRKFVTAHEVGEWAYESASPPANIITDLAVRNCRRTEWDRCIVHYMQPHKPFISRSGDRGDFTVKEWSTRYGPYHRYFNGELSLQDLHEKFVENLRYVLDEVEILLNNVDAPNAVLTADHGQALGEGGLWDHTPGVNHPSMRSVPWVETNAVDTHGHQPKEYESTKYDDETVKRNLKMLGYR